MPSTIRAPRPNELELLREIERAAGVLFTQVGLGAVAEHEPETAATLGEYLRAGRAWVATDDDDVPVGYAVVDLVDDCAHLEQISVAPDHGRRGLGATLLEHVCAWAQQHGYPAVTLTTFAEVPFNAPFYAKHGFRGLSATETGPQLAARREHEAALGLDPSLRVCMRRDVAPHAQ